MSTRRLGQRDVVTGETRCMPDGTHAECVAASDTHVSYWYTDANSLDDPYVIRRDVWTSWPVIEEADR